MKNLIIAIIALFLVPQVSFGQNKIVSDFINDFKSIEDATRISISGNLLDFAFASDDGDEKVSQKITDIQLFQTDKANAVSKAQYNRLIKDLKSVKFEDFMSVRNEGDNINMYIIEKGNKITNFVLAIRGADNFLLLSINGLFDMDELKEMDIDIEGMEEIKRA